MYRVSLSNIHWTDLGNAFDLYLACDWPLTYINELWLTLTHIQEQLDGHRKQQMVANDDERTEGGIDISKARLRLANEDKLDKKIYRQKIQKKHRVSYSETNENIPAEDPEETQGEL